MKKMLIILFSDNHGEASIIPYLKNRYPNADAFVHCGDSCMPPQLMQGIVSVEGNNDPFNAYPFHRILHYGRYSIYVCHGHRDMFYGRWDMLARKAKQNSCNMVFFGHTHIPFDKTVDGIRILNPGSSWHNRDGSKPGYMEVYLSDDNVEVKRIIWEKDNENR